MKRFAVLILACNGVDDIAFIFDSSSNINSVRFSQAKEFMKTFVDNINVVDDQSNVAFITYNSVATLRFDLDAYHTRNDLKSAVDNVTFVPDSGSNLADALRLARQTVFVSTRGDRPQYPNIIIIVTNRASTNATATSEQAKQAKLAGISIVTIAINGWLSASELYDITSEPVAVNLYNLSSYDQLVDTALRALKPAICELGKTIGNNISRRHLTILNIALASMA